jgi:hypothetical protein
VRRLLQQSAAFQSLPANTRRAIADDTALVSAFLASDVTNEVDFPSFVAGLVEGVFQAIVDTSIRQMEAYATLIATIAKTVPACNSDNDCRRRVARQVLMGINRLVVTSGRSRK